MEKPTLHNPSTPLKTMISFVPVIQAWKDKLQANREASSLYSELFAQLENEPLFKEPIEDPTEILAKNKLIQKLFHALFPVTVSSEEGLFAVVRPLTQEVLYCSESFNQTFLQEESKFRPFDGYDSNDAANAESWSDALQLVLQKLFDQEVSGKLRTVDALQDKKSGTQRYFEIESDNRFVNVRPLGELPELPEEWRNSVQRTTDISRAESMMEWFQPELFSFEGITIVHIRDVTERQVIANIKNHLLELQSFSEAETFTKLQDEVRSLVGLGGLSIGITPIFYINKNLVFPPLHCANSIFLKNLVSEEDRRSIVNGIEKLFESRRESVVIPSIEEETMMSYSFLNHIKQQGWCSIIICPLFSRSKLIGTLEILAEDSDNLKQYVVQKIELALPLFELALQKAEENLEEQIHQVIRDQFTAVQPSVEWKFINTALKYLIRKQEDEDAKIDTIVFDNVYPLYGAIDVRDSSTERNAAIQKDLLEQLEMALAIVKKARKLGKFPLLRAVDYKIRRYIHSVSNIMLSDDEMSINYFLKQEIVKLFQHLRSVFPDLQDDIAKYFVEVTTVVDMVYRNRKKFDQSMTIINNAVARFIDREQEKAQEVFPHYFERFVTDGVDFNIYIGQSIHPDKLFDEFYLRNIKLWQINTLARAAQLSKQLQKTIPIPLETTQLILAHGHPISISFRTAERKFDVDGAYNIRYEIIKKRIDKVRIKDSNERLSQPGMLAIVYTQPNEAQEYLEYIEFLREQNIFNGEIEWHELEELQGVSGLKAMRVQIRYEEQSSDDKKKLQPAQESNKGK